MGGVRVAVFKIEVIVSSAVVEGRTVFRTLHAAQWCQSFSSMEFTCRALEDRVHWMFLFCMNATDEEVIAARGRGLYALYRLYNGVRHRAFVPVEYQDAFSRFARET